MCSAPVAVTRRCPFPASSSLSPAESASRATAACTPPAPAWISNWINPSLPRQIKAPASTQRGAAAPTLPRAMGGFSEGRGWGMWEPCTLVAGAWGTARRDRPGGRSASSWGSPSPAVPPLPSVPAVCMCLRACVCVYIIIYISLFAGRLRQWAGSWRQSQLSGLRVAVPLVNCCRQTILRREGEEGGQCRQRRRSRFQSLLTLPNDKLLFGNLLLLEAGVSPERAPSPVPRAGSAPCCGHGPPCPGAPCRRWVRWPPAPAALAEGSGCLAARGGKGLNRGRAQEFCKGNWLFQTSGEGEEPRLRGGLLGAKLLLEQSPGCGRCGQAVTQTRARMRLSTPSHGHLGCAGVLPGLGPCGARWALSRASPPCLVCVQHAPGRRNLPEDCTEPSRIALPPLPLPESPHSSQDLLHTWLRGVVGCHRPLLWAGEEPSVLPARAAPGQSSTCPADALKILLVCEVSTQKPGRWKSGERSGVTITRSKATITCRKPSQRTAGVRGRRRGLG